MSPVTCQDWFSWFVCMGAAVRCLGYDVDCAGFPCWYVVVRNHVSLFLSGDGCPDYIRVGGSVFLLRGGVSSS